MKLIRCDDCGYPIALTHHWQVCECGRSGGLYMPDGHKATVAGPCSIYGISNKLFFGMRAECWPYDESNGRITRLAELPREAADS